MEICIIGSEGVLFRQAQETALLLRYSRVATNGDPVGIDGQLFIAVDDPTLRQEMMQSVPREQLVNLIHPSAVISPSARMGNNNYVGPLATMGMNATVGHGIVLNTRSSIEHDNVIGDFSFFGTGVTLCGWVKTEERVFVGGGAIVKPGVTIGEDTILGTGAVLVKDADPASTYIGNPARKKKAKAEEAGA